MDFMLSQEILPTLQSLIQMSAPGCPQPGTIPFSSVFLTYLFSYHLIPYSFCKYLLSTKYVLGSLIHDLILHAMIIILFYPLEGGD